MVKERGHLCTLSELYGALKRAGFILIKSQGKARPRRSGQIPFHVSQHRLLSFLRDNPGVVTTYKELLSRCNVPVLTGYHLISSLKASGKIAVKKIREGRTWKTTFTLLIVDTLRKEALAPENRDIDMKGGVIDVLSRVSRVGLPAGFRNSGVFILSLVLRTCGFSENEALERLRPRFSLSQYVGNHRFSEGEFRKTVRSAFQEKYCYCAGYKNEKWVSLLRGLAKLECELGRNSEHGSVH